MTGEFPALSRVFVSERDVYLAHSLKLAARPIPSPYTESGMLFNVGCFQIKQNIIFLENIKKM